MATPAARSAHPARSDPARPGRASAKLILWLGVLLMVMGLVLLIAVALDAPDIS